jgi:hypothetical protein
VWGGSIDCTTYGQTNDCRMDSKKGLERNTEEMRETDEGEVYKG